MRRVRALVGVALVVAGGTGLATVEPTGAQDADSTTYTVAADAQSALVRLEFPDAGLVVGSEVLNATPTRASTQLDSLGTSSAFAAAGYPGDIAFTLPSTLVGIASGYDGVRDLVPLIPPVPAYPLAAQSDAVNPVVKTESGAFTVSASTLGDESIAEALLGADEEGVTALSARSTSVSRFDPDTSTATTEGSAEVNGFRVANLLEISQRTTGSASVGAGGTPSLSTETFFGISLLGSGLQAGFGPNGLEAVGQSLLDRTAVEAVLAALAATGIAIDYVPEVRSEDGTTVTSAGMRISTTFTAPDEAAFLNDLLPLFNANVGRIITSVTLGRVTVRATSGSLPEPSFGGGGTPSGSGGPSSSGASPGSGAVTRPSVAPTVPAAAVVPSAPAAPASSGPAPVSAVEPVLLSMSSFYLALVGAGIAALASSRLLGLLAVRLKLRGAIA